MSRSLCLLALLAIPIVLPHNTLAQPSRAADGDGPVTRVTWAPNPDGSVRQHWERSADQGATWTTVFDGHSVRAEEE